MSHKSKSSSHIQPRLDVDDVEQTLDNNLSGDAGETHTESKKINQKTQRIVGIIFFMLIAFLIVPQFMQGPPEIPVITPAPKEPNIDTARPSVTIQVNQEGNILPTNVDSGNVASQDSTHSSLNINSSESASNTANPNIESADSVNSTDLINIDSTKSVLEPISTEITPTQSISVPKQVPELQVKSTKTKSIIKPSSKVEATTRQVAKPIKNSAAKLPVISLLSASQTAGNVKTDRSNSVQTKAGSYHIQTGVFSKEKNATDEHKKLNAAGFSVAIMRAGSQFKVRVGPFMDEKSAKLVMSKLKNSGYATALIKP